ncbi:hypothetical protein [Nesterenkonia ebinurensis]|uniref:hypothetical protein n=1 Tax=Nesterenkonia ebinurensis TaxID=2608252 RepID=UPI00123DEE6D|nr:hypothetical protein [Nesterenkonia ebinurensis]
MRLLPLFAREGDETALIEFISGQHYPHQMRSYPGPEQVRTGTAKGAYGYGPEHYATEAAAETDHRE